MYFRKSELPKILWKSRKSPVVENLIYYRVEIFGSLAGIDHDLNLQKKKLKTWSWEKIYKNESGKSYSWKFRENSQITYDLRFESHFNRFFFLFFWECGSSQNDNNKRKTKNREENFQKIVNIFMWLKHHD
jgi:hypothetical protein